MARCSGGIAWADAAGAGVSLGRSRALDIVLNAIVPLLILYGQVHGAREVCRRALRLYGAIPPLQENSITVRMRRDLVQGRLPLRTARDQQGLLQLHQRYCLRGRCRECALGASADE